MKTILISPQEIESCWETTDICFVRTKSNKVWLCKKNYPIYNISTKEFIKSFDKNELMELPLAEKGDSYGKR